MTGFIKVSESLLTSSVWDLPTATRLVWVTLLLSADRDGVVVASVPWLARRAGVSQEDCEAAVASLMSPDPSSRTRDYDGRRIEESDNGWTILNYKKHQALGTASKQSNRARQARYRQRQKAARAAKGTG